MSEPTPEELDRKIRDEIDADFKANKLGIENGWLFAYTDPCPRPCADGFGCPPSCHTEPIVDLATLGRVQPVTITDEMKGEQ